MPRVTVGILTHNRKDAVLKAIESALRQQVEDLEVLVVDSDSSDGTSEAIQTRFPQVRVVRLPRNLGCPGGRNHVYANALGDCVVNLDDDGRLGEGAVSRVIEILASDPRIGIVAMARRDFGETDLGDLSERPRPTCRFSGGVSAFRRSMLQQIGCYPEDFFLLKEEEFLALRALDAGYRIVFCPDAVMWHPREGRNGSAAAARDFYRVRNALLVVCRLFPGRLLVKYLALRMASYALWSLRRGSFYQYLLAVGSVFCQLPGTLWRRRPCRPETIREYFRLRHASVGTRKAA